MIEQMDTGVAATALLLVLLAGLGTGMGGLIPLVMARTSGWLLGPALGFSAGVMIYVALVRLLPAALEAMEEGGAGAGAAGDGGAAWAAKLAFIAGLGLMALLDMLVPAVRRGNGHAAVASPDAAAAGTVHRPLGRTAMFAAGAIVIHNIPEGVATFTVAAGDLMLGLAVALAMAIRNIPEGLAIAVPVYYATGSRLKGLGLSILAGLAEPLGAAGAFILLAVFFSPALVPMVMAAVAGMLVFLAFSELVATAQRFGQPRRAIGGLLLGIAAMAVVLLVAG